MRFYRFLLLFGLLACYVLPWVSTNAAAMTMNGYDLAEWASLHPDVRSSPLLLTSLLLRLPLVCAALLSAFSGIPSIFAFMRVVILAAALLPPLEFLTNRSDPNYVQQIVLAGVAFFGGLIGISGIVPRGRTWIVLLLSVLGVVITVLGLVQGYSLVNAFELDVQVGVGGIGSVVFYVLIALDTWLNETRQSSQLPRDTERTGVDASSSYAR